MMTQSQPTRTVYLLFTRSETCFSRLIHHFTNGEYTHASIGLDGPGGDFYSFARKYPRLPFPGGFMRERADRGFFSLHPHTPCCLCELEVSAAAYAYLRQRLRAMYAQRERYHYNLLGVLSALFRRPLMRRRHKFCSEFVAEMLWESGAAQLSQTPGLTRPMDLWGLESLRPVHRGEVWTLAGAA